MEIKNECQLLVPREQLEEMIYWISDMKEN